uniref:Uncharacterized protein n=1 Tax=Anguilla anguilla TaxID=7936 RepID=A0A0E9UVX4_ANGAN
MEHSGFIWNFPQWIYCIHSSLLNSRFL